ncbi:glycoside hydrolase family 43 protein [Chitinophaga filiformis]|uniref:glycoside hydrolase family 43 protein n=1 Tax=Chitinophaga filiformis TaxID=104663 RepID=UPI001F37905A|nr:glycoside hydrolase family 43 protein [Chitinophaga filiformis]MCF6405118.1 glycoside hydrolase family 43 protein [Chitinophaga filiformis]
MKIIVALWSLMLVIPVSMTGFAQQQSSIIPGAVWTDTDGNPINAHGGGMLYYAGTWYWYGEIKKGDTWRVPGSTWENNRVNAGGVSCYSSKDLLHWKYESVALAPDSNDSTSDLHISKVIERPKVIYNKKTGKFVMWMHIDSQDYSYARSGVAVGDQPEGPFRYIGSVRPNGNMARDMTIFQDDDGKAYHFYSSEENQTMHICELTDDYLSHTPNDHRILIKQAREAPAVCKYNNRFYLFTSGCTGWSPNAASYATADSIMGTWTEHTNPCQGTDADSTFHAQSTFVLPVSRQANAFIFMADRWNKNDLETSRYIWLPLTFDAEDKPGVQWKDEWKLSGLTGN